MFKHKKILVFDFETTGLDPFVCQVIEVGAILLEKNDNHEFVEKEALSILVKAQGLLDPKITQITQITNQMLKEQGVEQEDACQRLLNLYDDDTLLIAYNILFDLGFLQAMMRNYYEVNFKIKNDILDVMAVYKDRHSFPHRLDQAVAKYQIDIKNTHRALDDVRATYAVLKQMGIEKDNLEKYVNVIGYNAKYPIRKQIDLPKVKYVAQRGGFREIENA
jgi:DNA polymerase III subunit epsilon